MGRVTVRGIAKRYREGRPITMVTCYDATFARLVERASIDAILVGDSLGNVIQGHETTLPVELDDIIYHTKAVARGNATSHLISDLPFMSYQAGEDEAMRNAGALMKCGGAQAVKLEGGERVAGLVERLVGAGIPVCGHLGFTPQSHHTTGGYRVQGRGTEASERLVRDARALEEAGAYMLVLEMVPAALAERVTEELSIPTIGIGAGAETSGQVLVLYDLLGLDERFSPTFLKRFARLEGEVVGALEAYAREVKSGAFPGPEHTYGED